MVWRRTVIEAPAAAGPAKPGGRFTLLEPLRGLAALWVLGFHYHFSPTFRSRLPFLEAFFRAGDLGVPMFFVISGYCITASARGAIRNREPWPRFLRRRLLRIYPPFWASIAVVAAIPFAIELLSVLKTGRYEPPSTANHNYGYLTYQPVDWLMIASLAQVFRQVPAETGLQAKFTTINAVYWTLAIEVQFYLAATLALQTGRHFYKGMLLITAVSLPTLFVPALRTSGVFLPYWPMFAVGVALFWAFERGGRPSNRWGASVTWPGRFVALSLGIALVVQVARRGPIDSLAFAVLFGVFLLAIEGFDGRFPKAGLASRALLTLGAMSYSVYLLHGRLQFLVMQVARQALPADSLAFDLIVIAAMLAICYGFHVLAERPFISSGAASARVRESERPGRPEVAPA